MFSSPDGLHPALHQFLQENIESLQGIIRSYVVKTGLAHGESVQDITGDVLNETTVNFLANPEKFYTVQQPRAWFLGIAANIIRRRRANLIRHSQRELSIATFLTPSETDREGDFFEQLSNLASPSPEQEVEAREQVTEMLALVAPSDRHILRLAILQDLDTQALALTLKVQPGAARTRLHRAIQRLRIAWHEQQRERENERRA